jgi:hypothetical protein
MAKQALTVKVRITGLRETLKKFRGLPKDASKELRTETLRLSEFLTLKAKAAGFAQGRQSGVVAGTIRAQKDRVPAVVMGGTKRLGRNKAPAYKIMFGAEFGMNARSGWYAKPRYADSPGRQYRPHRGRAGYFFFPTVEQSQSEVAAAWNKVADDIVAKFSEGG